MLKGLTFFVFLFVVGIARAKTLELKKSTKSIYIQERAGWTLGKDLFGMPFIYFSPQVNGQRSNISFTDTGAEVELDVQTLSENQKDYQENKKKWAEKVLATPEGFSSHEVSLNKHGHKVHQIGFNYRHEDKSYVEKSYYVECRGKIIFAKSLRLRANEEHAQDFDDLVGSLDCGGL